MFKKILLMFILMLSLNAGLLKEFNSFNTEQKEIMNKVYNQCEPFNLQYSCIAIAWKESSFGKYKINFKTKDYGIMGINLHYHLISIKLKKNRWNKSLIATRLITNDYYNIQWGINNLLYWKEVHKDNWYKIWGSYNGGFNINYNYAKDIKRRIDFLKIYRKDK